MQRADHFFFPISTTEQKFEQLSQARFQS